MFLSLFEKIRISLFTLGVSKEIYYFFDGNENDIKLFKKNYLEKNITLESFSFKIKTVEDILKNISEMQNYLFYNSENGNYLDLVIKYNKSIEFLVKEVKFWNMENIYFMLNELEIEVKKNREFLINFLAKIIIIFQSSNFLMSKIRKMYFYLRLLIFCLIKIIRNTHYRIRLLMMPSDTKMPSCVRLRRLPVIFSSFASIYLCAFAKQ